MAHSSLRFGMGRFTTEAEVDYVVEKIVAVVSRLRDMRYAHPICHPQHLYSPVVGTAPCGRWSKRVSISTPSTGHNTKVFMPSF